MLGVTGSTGFIGAKLCEKLHENGIKYVPFRGRLENLDNVRDFFAGGVKTLIHLAGHVPIDDDEKSRLGNVVSMRNIVDEGKKQGLESVVFSSTCGLYRYSHTPVSENGELDLRDIYAKTKSDAEEILRESEVKQCILRLSNAYGGGKGVVDIFNRRFKAGQPISIIGTGNELRDYLHVDDAVTALMNSVDYMDNNGESTICNIGGNCVLSIRDLINFFVEKHGNRSSISHGERQKLAGSFIPNTSHAREVIGFKPKHTSLHV